MPERDYDMLLRFVSEAGSGSWADFKQACDWIFADPEADGAVIAATNLASLGHIEISWTEERWAAASPLITMLPGSGGRALVTGARTASFGKTLKEAVKRRELYLNTRNQAHAPTTWLVACSNADEVADLAMHLGAAYTYSAATQLGELLPSLRDLLRLSPQGELTEGFEVDKFDPRSLSWGSTPEAATPGLYRCRTFRRREHALLDERRTWRRVPRELGIYAVLKSASRSVLHHTREGELRVPGRCGLPAIHARAATLCSGRAPGTRIVRENGRRFIYLTFANVPIELAQKIATSLEQRLEEGG
jgi:hypothetical protein